MFKGNAINATFAYTTFNLVNYFIDNCQNIHQHRGSFVIELTMFMRGQVVGALQKHEGVAGEYANVQTRTPDMPLAFGQAT